MSINSGQAGSGYNSSDAWDYYHINSVDKNSDGDYLISARDACSIHKINGSDGTIIWRLGGKRNSFYLGEGVEFCFQHHARFLSQRGDIETISLYDNSAHGTESGRGREVRTAPTSSGKILELNTRSLTASLVQGYYPPDDLLSKSQGSTHVLPNQNVLVNWGSEGAMTEFLPNGTVIFHAYMDSGYLGKAVENYRAYRYNWTGLPNEEPAIAAYTSIHGTTAYVSWNGDTETRVWRFYGLSEGETSATAIEEVQRKSFETALVFRPKAVTRVYAVALNEEGDVIGRTDLASVRLDVHVEYNDATEGRSYFGSMSGQQLLE